MGTRYFHAQSTSKVGQEINFSNFDCIKLLDIPLFSQYLVNVTKMKFKNESYRCFMLY